MAQAVIAAANRTTRAGLDPAYPVGKVRLEAVAIILCAALMAMGAGEVVQQCALKLAKGSSSSSSSGGGGGEGGGGHRGSNDDPTRGPRITGPALWTLVGVVVVKVALFAVCYRWRHVSGSIRALAFDHVADAMSNTVALVAAVLAGWQRTRDWLGPEVWMADPIGRGTAAGLHFILFFFGEGGVEEGGIA